MKVVETADGRPAGPGHPVDPTDPGSAGAFADRAARPAKAGGDARSPGHPPARVADGVPEPGPPEPTGRPRPVGDTTAVAFPLDVFARAAIAAVEEHRRVFTESRAPRTGTGPRDGESLAEECVCDARTRRGA
ncbi:hypothetical protein [Streptomyces fructofermentans]|uniref:hypothetical protein n=1 Tax=Streptomyces fructofermentans TaxID=152141 RepID=UPI0033FAEA15